MPTEQRFDRLPHSFAEDEMNRKIINEVLRNGAGFTVLTAMLVTAGLTGEREIIFPEVGALAVGLLVIDRTVWNTGKLRMILLLCLESAIGVWMMRHTGDLPVWIPVSAAFLFANFLVLLFRSTLLPAVAACLMPLYLSVDKYAYVFYVFCLACLLCLLLTLLERTHCRTKHIPLWGRRSRYLWTKVLFVPASLLCLLPLFIVASSVNRLFVIAPPLVVTFLEFARSSRGYRKRPWKILAMLCVAAGLSTGFILTCRQLGLPSYAGGICAAASTLVLYKFARQYFAPAMAVALLALHADAATLPVYPFLITTGGFYCIILATMPRRIVAFTIRLLRS